MAKEAVGYIEYLLTKEKLDKRDRSRLEAALAELRGKPKAQKKDLPQDFLTQAVLGQTVEEFLTDLHNPEVVTHRFQTIWQERERRLREAGVDLSLAVPSCTYTQEELKQLESEGRRVGYLDPKLATQKARHLLATIWPEMGSYTVQEGNSVRNEGNRHGWFDYEVAIDAPYTKTSEDQLRTEARNLGLEGLTLNQYIVAGQDSKLFTGKYLDQDRTRVRLLGSRDGGLVVSALFDGDGRLVVRWDLDPRDRNPRLGGRFAGVPKKA